MTNLQLYHPVELVNDAHAGEGAVRGMIGYIIEDHGQGNYDVEFSDPVTGETLALLQLRADEIISAPGVED